MHRLDLGSNELAFRPWRLASQALPLILKIKPDVCFVPAYWHWSLFVNAAARAAGARIVMMNDTHAGTARARNLKYLVKRQIVRSFHSALVAGSPQRRYFSDLGLAPYRIFTGYDVVDNNYFAAAAAAVREDAQHYRRKYALPERYFLNLGRFVDKKNLTVLVEAFALSLKFAAPDSVHHLVFVGDGTSESDIRKACENFGVPVVDHDTETDSSVVSPTDKGAVHFYGFKQLAESPVFYALATAFVLPSIYDEWGLVVNEAMACSLPVLVSEGAGCAEDLVLQGVNGFRFNPHDIDALAQLLKLLAADGDLAKTMGAASGKRIREWGCERFASGGIAAVREALN
ncbi:D-inositol-3-phosphate glycosyltransferase [Mycolicibacterium parafortuitum]